jgi:hypothetical protein
MNSGHSEHLWSSYNEHLLIGKPAEVTVTMKQGYCSGAGEIKSFIAIGNSN